MIPNSNCQNRGFQILLETKLQEEEIGWIFIFIAGKPISDNELCGFIFYFFKLAHL